MCKEAFVLGKKKDVPTFKLWITALSHTLDLERILNDRPQDFERIQRAMEGWTVKMYCTGSVVKHLCIAMLQDGGMGKVGVCHKKTNKQQNQTNSIILELEDALCLSNTGTKVEINEKALRQQSNYSR